MQEKIQKFVSAFFIILGAVLLLFNYFKKPAEIFFKTEELNLVDMADIPILNNQDLETESADAEKEKLLKSISAEAVYVMDNPSAATLLAKNENKKLFPASTVKILTALTALRIYGDEDKFIVENGDFEHGNKNDLVIGEELSLNDLLKLLLITSDNDAALLLAKHHYEGYKGFIREMNTLAQELGLESSFFKDPIGFDDYQQQSTAKDLAILSFELMKHDVLYDIVGIKETQITDTSGEIAHNLHTTNQFLAEEFGIMGVKTGTTDLAGEVLVTQVEKAGKSIMIVVMNSQNRFTDTKKIIDYIYNNYSWVKYQELLN